MPFNSCFSQIRTDEPSSQHGAANRFGANPPNAGQWPNEGNAGQWGKQQNAGGWNANQQNAGQWNPNQQNGNSGTVKKIQNLLS